MAVASRSEVRDVTRVREGKPGGLGPIDVWLALLFALLFTLLFAFTLQTRLSGDGSVLGSHAYFRAHGQAGLGADYPHVLYLPAADLFGRLFRWLESSDPLLPSKLLSAVCAGVGAGCCFLIARAFGAGRATALLAMLLVGLSPALWHFGTTIEVHAFHFAVVSLCALVTLFAPWRRPVVAVALVALTLPLVYLSHQASVLLGLGWVCLVQLARTRKHAPFAWTTLWLGIAPLLLAVLLATMVAVNQLLHGEAIPKEGDHREYVEVFFGAAGNLRAAFAGGWLLPLFLLAPLGVFGLLRRSERAWARPTAAAMVLPQLAFFLFWVWWAVGERGGYFLSTAPFLAAVAAMSLGLHRAPGILTFCVILVLSFMQGAAARFVTIEYDQGFDPRERAAVVRSAIGETGLLVTAQATGPRIDIYVPGVRESRVGSQIAEALSAGLTPDEFVEQRALPLLDQALTLLPVAFDQSYLALPRPADDRRAPYMEAFQHAVETRYATRLVPDAYWPMLVIEGRK